MTKDRSKSLSWMRRLAAVAAGAALGITGAVAVASSPYGPRAPSCPPTEADLLRAADSARIVEAQRADLFEQSIPRATYDDLRLAAEWARRLALLDPSRAACATP